MRDDRWSFIHYLIGSKERDDDLNDPDQTRPRLLTDPG